MQQSGTELDTIAAIATPLGEGGLAVVRLSGPQALTIADRCFRPAGSGKSLVQTPTHRLRLGVVSHKGRAVDEVLAAVMRAPRTYTREDVVEISCHGGVLASKLVLDALLENGARLAHPGEFTRRAFLNGRLDLAQAEAVADLIHARTEAAVRAANEQLAGKLSQRVNELRQEMLNTLAHIEAHIDFPDEDIAPNTRRQLIQRLEQGVRFMDELLRTAGDGQILRRGVRVAIVGRPNVGKSSLLNQLLGHDRAIVSPIPGTTRDTIEETASIRGIPIVFVDTAGLREGTDEIESEGIRRSRQTIEKAELVLHVLDASQVGWETEAQQFPLDSERKQFLVVNKVDLCDSVPVLAASPVQTVSCKTGVGIEGLKDRIRELVWSGSVSAENAEAMINSRHQNALERAKRAALQAIAALQEDRTLELVAVDLRIAVGAVGEIVGQTTTEDLLDAIFSQFCIGK